MGKPWRGPKATPPHGTDSMANGPIRQLAFYRDVAVSQVKLIYDALAIIRDAAEHSPSKAAGKAGQLGDCASLDVSCQRIDLAVRDVLTDALEEISWTASAFGSTPETLLNLQARLLLQQLDESDETSATALAHSIATAISA